MANKEKPKLHYTDSYLFEPLHRVTISVIGCGGTGSFILSKLARLDYALSKLDHPGLHITAYDNDTVEEYNIGRQNFTPYDIGQNKAMCLIEKINMAYGTQWIAKAEKVDAFNNYDKTNFIITAVDNVETRMKLSKYIASKKSKYNNDYNRELYWIDAGNGKDFGQVILSTIDNIKQPTSKKFETVDKLENIVEKYGDLSKFDNEKTQGMKSCSMAESLSKQDLFINDTVALYVVDIISRLLRDLKIDYSGVIINQATLATKPLAL